MNYGLWTLRFHLWPLLILSNIEFTTFLSIKWHLNWHVINVTRIFDCFHRSDFCIVNMLSYIYIFTAPSYTSLSIFIIWHCVHTPQGSSNWVLIFHIETELGMLSINAFSIYVGIFSGFVARVFVVLCCIFSTIGYY